MEAEQDSRQRFHRLYHDAAAITAYFIVFGCSRSGWGIQGLFLAGAPRGSGS